MDEVGDGHSDGIGQTPARLGEPVEEGMGAASGIGADQSLPASPQALGELGQGESGGFDVIARGVCVAGPQQRGGRLTGTGLAVVDERDERTMAERLLPGPSGILLLGVSQGRARRRCPQSPSPRRPDFSPLPVPGPTSVLRPDPTGSRSAPSVRLWQGRR